MKKVWILSTSLAMAMGALPVQADDAAPLAATGQGVTVQYAGSVMIFQVADIVVNGVFEQDTYQASARFTAAGLAALFTDADIEAGVSGYRNGPNLLPWRYSHLNHASSKGRIVGIDFPEGVATPDINPPFGNMGEPPANEDQRRGAADPLSTLLSVGLGAAASEEAPCEGSMPVFDGRARYNLRFEYGGQDQVRTRAWSGEAAVCHAFYEPIAGYEADEFPSDDLTSNPITMWFAEVDDGVRVPVRIRTNAGFGGVTVTARSIQVD